MGIRAAESLIRLNNESVEASETLLKYLESESLKEAYIVDMLGDLKHASPEIISALIKFLNNKRKYSIDAWSALVKLGKKSNEVIVSLIRRLEDSNYYIRNWSAVILAELGEKSSAITAVFINMLQKGEDGFLAFKAIEYLNQSSFEVISALKKTLKNSNEKVRWKAAIVLSQFGEESLEISAILSSAFNDSNSFDTYNYSYNFRRNAVIGLANLKQPSPEIISAIVNMVINFSYERNDIKVLENLEQVSPAIIFALIKETSGDKKLFGRIRAVSFLVKLGYESPEIIAVLSMLNLTPGHLIEFEKNEVQSKVVEALGSLKQPSHESSNQLINILESPVFYSHEVQKKAADALGKIGKMLKQKTDNSLEVSRPKQPYNNWGHFYDRSLAKNIFLFFNPQDADERKTLKSIACVSHDCYDLDKEIEEENIGNNTINRKM